MKLKFIPGETVRNLKETYNYNREYIGSINNTGDILHFIKVYELPVLVDVKEIVPFATTSYHFVDDNGVVDIYDNGIELLNCPDITEVGTFYLAYGRRRAFVIYKNTIEGLNALARVSSPDSPEFKGFPMDILYYLPNPKKYSIESKKAPWTLQDDEAFYKRG